jgi:hypothetical protein
MLPLPLLWTKSRVGICMLFCTTNNMITCVEEEEEDIAC